MKQYQRILYLILTMYVFLAGVYSSVTPIFEASDELWHYPMVKYLADNGLSLPPQDSANPGPWRQEGSQPPLYYIMAAGLTSGIDTSDMERVRRINPHADIGIIRPDGNSNMMVHRQDAEAFPWRGTTLAVHVIRFFSIALGLVTVLVTYQLAREIFPDWPVIALGAVALNAFLPMFLFISGSVNNDNLSNLLGNLLTLLIVRLIKRRATITNEATSQPYKTYLLIGIVTGASLLAKLNIGFLIPLVGLALLIVSVRQRDWRPLIVGGVISGGLTIVIAGWWYLRNAQLYGDPTGLNMFLQVVGRRAVYANLPQLWSERNSFTQAYWGFFGGVNVPLPDWMYFAFNVIGVIGLAGAVGFISYRIVRKPSRSSSIPADTLSFQWLPALVTIIWPIITFVSYLRWTAETPASQGRLAFGALSAISMWMVVGLVWWLPKQLQGFVVASVSGYFALVAALTPFLIIAPAYALPNQLVQSQTSSPQTFSDASGGSISVLQNTVLTETVQPESYVNIDGQFQIGQPLAKDWSLFVHLVTPDGVIVWQRDVYPGGGKLATSDLASGYAWDNPVSIWIPATAYAPNNLNVEIGWYDLSTSERMKLADGTETLTIGQVDLEPRADTEALNVPNPIRVNFDNQIELVGYEMSDISPKAGDTVELTLYWRAMHKIEQDYKIFANILGPNQTKYAASDGMPVNWNAPTTTWNAGAIIKDVHTLKVDPNTPSGIYETEIGWYLQAADGSFPRLRIVTPDGGMADNYINLSRVRVLAAEDQP